MHSRLIADLPINSHAVRTLERPWTFRRTMDVILGTVKEQSALVYLDNAVIFSKTSEEYIRHTRKVFTPLNNADVTLKLKKCQIFTRTIDYLRHKIRPQFLEIASRTADTIQGLHNPTKSTNLRSFLGLSNVLRRFVQKFVRLAALLKRKLRMH